MHKFGKWFLTILANTFGVKMLLKLNGVFLPYAVCRILVAQSLAKLILDGEAIIMVEEEEGRSFRCDNIQLLLLFVGQALESIKLWTYSIKILLAH